MLNEKINLKRSHTHDFFYTALRLVKEVEQIIITRVGDGERGSKCL